MIRVRCYGHVKNTLYASVYLRSGKGKLEEAEELVVNLRKAIAELDTGQDLRDLTKLVSKKMKMQMLSENPLFFPTVSLRYQNSIWEVFGVY